MADPEKHLAATGERGVTKLNRAGRWLKGTHRRILVSGLAAAGLVGSVVTFASSPPEQGSAARDLRNQAVATGAFADWPKSGRAALLAVLTFVLIIAAYYGARYLHRRKP